MGSWRAPDDFGLEIVSFIHQSLRVENDWCVDSGARGFTWWAGEFAQHVWSEESNFYNCTATFKVHAETDLIRGRGHASPMVSASTQFFRPQGACQSRWIGVPEWQQTEWGMEREAEHFESNHRSHLKADFAWPNGEHVLLDVSAADCNPILGHGLT